MWEFVPQVHEIESEQVLPGDDMYSGVVVDLLEEMHLDEYVGVDGKISPVDVPITGLVTILDLPIQTLCHFRNHRVLRH